MIRIARAGLHFYEEPCISGDSGSGTIFFSGCDLGCLFCQNEEISRRGKGVNISDEQFVKILLHIRDMGANNINLVTPSKWISRLIPILKEVKPILKVPIVWNSGGYEDVDDIRKLEGLVDIYLPDFKYSDDALAYEYSRAKGYFEKASAAIREMRRQQPEDIFEDGLMKRGVIVRHLVLPCGVENTAGVMRRIAEIDSDMYVSLMAQYFPTDAVKDHPVLGRRITAKEYEAALDAFFAAGLKNGFSQDPDSAVEDYVPSFDLEELKQMLK